MQGMYTAEPILRVHVPLEALSLHSLVYYFQSLYNNGMFEVKGVHFNALPKTVDVCGAEVSLNVLSDNKEGLLCDSVQSKSILQFSSVQFIYPQYFTKYSIKRNYYIAREPRRNHEAYRTWTPSLHRRI